MNFSFVIDLFVVRLEPFRRMIILFLSIFFKYSSCKAELVTNTLSELLRKFFFYFFMNFFAKKDGFIFKKKYPNLYMDL